MFYAFLVLVCHAVMFCSYVQFLEWFNELSSVTENEEVTDYNDTEITELVEKDLFKVESGPLKFIRAKGNYNTDLSKLEVILMYIAEFSVQCYRTAQKLSGHLEKVVFKRVYYVSCSIPGWTYTIYNIPRSNSDDQVYFEEKEDSNKLKLIRKKHISMDFMEYLVDRMSNTRDLEF